MPTDRLGGERSRASTGLEALGAAPPGHVADDADDAHDAPAGIALRRVRRGEPDRRVLAPDAVPEVRAP